MSRLQLINVILTRYQAFVVADALTLYTEGALGQQTKRELRTAASVRRKLSRALTSPEESSE